MPPFVPLAVLNQVGRQYKVACSAGRVPVTKSAYEQAACRQVS